ncbi:hypothetical protein GCM10028784_38390 [Myceligenerans cantabricum]
MNPSAIALLVVSLVILWGGLGASIAMLVARPERTEWPEGGAGDDTDV